MMLAFLFCCLAIVIEDPARVVRAAVRLARGAL